MLEASVYSFKWIEKIMISLDVKIKESLERDNLLQMLWGRRRGLQSTSFRQLCFQLFWGEASNQRTLS
jgi:hypothetical protein